MKGRLIAVDDYRVAWEYRDTNGHCRHGIADNLFEAESQLAAIEKKFNTHEFSPSLGSPPECKITNSGEPPLCKFGPGGRYTTDYTPRQRRIAPRTVRSWLTQMLARLRTAKGQRG